MVAWTYIRGKEKEAKEKKKFLGCFVLQFGLAFLELSRQGRNSRGSKGGITY